MRRLTLIVALLPFAAAVQLHPVDVAFQAPLMAEADVDAGPWQWLVLFINPDGQAVANGTAADTTEVATISRDSVSIGYRGDLNTRIPVQERPETSSFGRGNVTAQRSKGWASILIEGQEISLEATAATASLDLHSHALQPSRFGSRQPHATALRWENLENKDHGTWMQVDPLDKGEPVKIRISSPQLYVIEWHGWDLSCPGDCGDATTDSTGTPDGPATGSLETHRYVRWSGNLSLVVEASAWLVVAGTTEPVSFGHAGVLRLPSATSSVFNATGDALRLDGTGTLSDLRAAGSGSNRFTGTLQGSYTGIQLGEAPVDLSSRAAQVATVAAVVLLPFFLRWLWLLSRSDRLSEVQEDLAEALRVAPGSSYRDLLRITGFSNGALDWHLRSLERRGLVASRDYKNTKRFFWVSAPRDWKRIVVTARDDLKPLLDWMKTRDAFILTDAAEALQTSRSTVHGWLSDLVDADMLHTYRDGRRRIYQYLPYVPDALPAVAVAAE